MVVLSKKIIDRFFFRRLSPPGSRCCGGLALCRQIVSQTQQQHFRSSETQSCGVMAVIQIDTDSGRLLICFIVSRTSEAQLYVIRILLPLRQAILELSRLALKLRVRGGHEDAILCFVRLSDQQWGAADANIKVPSFGNPELTNLFPLNPGACFAHCQEFIPCPNFYISGPFTFFFFYRPDVTALADWA